MFSAALWPSQFWVCPDLPSAHTSHLIWDSTGQSFLCQDGFLVPALFRWHITVRRSLEEPGCVCHCHIHPGCWYLEESENICSRYWWMMLKSCAGCCGLYLQGFLWKGSDGCTTAPWRWDIIEMYLGCLAATETSREAHSRALSQEHQAGCYRFSRPEKLAAVPGLLPIRKLKRWINSSVQSAVA